MTPMAKHMTTADILTQQAQNQFSYQELLQCGHGELFGPGNARLPLPPMLMFDRIAHISGEGGAHGKGLVITGDKAVGKTSLTQVTVGLQLGGQVYAEFIFFKDETALGHFQRGNFELNAQASAVAVTAGASADADYDKGVAIFTNVGGGLMYEASVGGQKFKYESL
jgi:hypothetical protein